MRESEEMYMHKIRNGSRAYITGNVIIKQKDGEIKSLGGSRARVISARKNFCLCDIGIEKPIFIPMKNLKAA